MGRRSWKKREHISPIIAHPHNFCLQRILVHCKPGIVHLWSPATMTPSASWSGHRVLRLQTQRLDVGSSCLHPASGVHYVRRSDVLVVCLFDGSFHVIRDFSREPAWSSSTSTAPTGDVKDALLTTEALSGVSRSLFVQAERRGELPSTEVNRISGMMGFDGAGTVLWLHEFVI
jgi:general transcription factor 3C polypeptide 4